MQKLFSFFFWFRSFVNGSSQLIRWMARAFDISSSTCYLLYLVPITYASRISIAITNEKSINEKKKKNALSNWQFRWTETLGKFILFCFQSITVIHLCVLLSSVMAICVLWRTKIKIFSIKTARTVCYASINCRSGAYGTHSWSRNIHRNQKWHVSRTTGKPII